MIVWTIIVHKSLFSGLLLVFEFFVRLLLENGLCLELLTIYSGLVGRVI